MEFSKMKHNSVLVEEGDWVKDIPGMGDLELKVRGSNSRSVRNAFSEKMSIVENQTTDARDRVVAEIAEESVLLGWKNLTNNGVEVPYSQEQAHTWLHDPDFRDFSEAVDYASREVARKARANQETTAKNSERSSTGKSGTAAKQKA